MQLYLRRKGDELGRAFAYTPELAARKDDFEVCEGPTMPDNGVKQTVTTSQRLLRRKGDDSGRVFAYNPVLAVKEEFEEVIIPTAIPQQPETAAKQTLPEDPLAQGQESADVNDANKEQLIIAAIATLDPEDFTAETPTSPPKPRTDVLSRKLGFKVTAVERDAAYKEYIAQENG